MIVVLLIIAIIYVPAIGWLIFGALRLPKFKVSNTKPITKFSIIIPFRNEETNLEALLQSIDALAYPSQLFELILVNDASEDKGELIIHRYLEKSQLQITMLQNNRISGSPKKDAIRKAMEVVQHEWIISTDADCELPKNWLLCYDQLIRKEAPNMICGPVTYKRNKSFLNHFQFLDGLSLQGVALGSFGWKQPLLCNGANLAYKRSIFEAVEAFQSNDHIASGDDIFLLEKIQSNYPNTAYYLNCKEAVVLTKAEESWSQVIQQRIRWASKTSKQKNAHSKLLGAVVFLGNLAFLASFALIAWSSSPIYFIWMTICFKIAVDLTLLKVAGHLLGRSFSFFQFLANIIIYPLLTIWVVINSFGGNYQWKGRNFKK